MRLGWAVTTDHFSSRAPDATQHECCEPGPNLLCMGLFSRFCVRALRCTAHSTSKTRVNALRCVRDTRSLGLRAYCESIQLQPIMLQWFMLTPTPALHRQPRLPRQSSPGAAHDWLPAIHPP